VASGTRDGYTREAVRQVIEHGRSVPDVAQRREISVHRLYAWKTSCARSEVVLRAELNQNVEVHRLKAELTRVTEKHGILKKAAAYLAKG